METTPSVIWFMRHEMRRRRGALSLPRFRTLVRVDKGDAGVSAVATHLGTSVPTASRIVAGLVQRGLLARGARGQDKRRVGLNVTPRGLEVLHAARAGTLTRLEAELEALTATERGAVVRGMELLRRVFAPRAALPTNATEESHHDQ